jgi:hypothetical protein
MLELLKTAVLLLDIIAHSCYLFMLIMSGHICDSYTVAWYYSTELLSVYVNDVRSHMRQKQISDVGYVESHGHYDYYLIIIHFIFGISYLTMWLLNQRGALKSLLRMVQRYWLETRRAVPLLPLSLITGLLPASFPAQL